MSTRTPSTESKPARTPLGRRGRVEINHTLLRVVGKDQAPALDVAAFQSFAD